MKPLGKSSFPLQKALLTGAHFTNAEIRFYKNAADPKDAAYYTIVLTNVFVSAFQSSGSGAEIPMESVSIAFASIQWKLILPTPANGISINPVLTWDVTKNAAQ
jgi:type VI secretion system Hcp family effector